MPECEKLIKRHEEFHKLAGQLINACQQDKEAKAIEAEIQFIEASQDVIKHLHTLQDIKS
ncbi:MAG TPA: hypothetical protein DDW45_05195 [Gammaproteobacteria bacterium]|nr:hypothetical protein [Gammaproteobacteria bacterium]